ncbi:MAG: hypothetical protein ACXAES_17090 [Promethearchaeota archaeon]|jgi:tRNA wybutosine-synthesizing protein 1
MKNQFIVDNRITNKFVETYTKTTYRIIGESKHTAIKPCHWLEQRLMTGRDNRNCYKGVFGVKSNRCIQLTPSLPFCNHQCVFCWRDIESGSLGIMIDILNHMLINGSESHSNDSLSNNIHVSKNKIERATNLLKNQNFIKPKNNQLTEYELDDDIQCCIDSREEVEKLINRALTTPDEIMQAHSEAMNPNHAAISLDGEPLLYPRMSDLIREFKNRSMTTFIVTNGTLPERIIDLELLPSQLYITLPAPNEQIYKRACRPMIKNGWQKLNKTLELIDSLSCRTLVRLTAIKNLNISKNYIKDYIQIIKKSNPHFFEIKGFTLQAKALSINDRLKTDYPPSFYFPEYDFLEDFALEFEKLSGLPIIYKNYASRDFLFAVNWEKDKDPKISEV